MTFKINHTFLLIEVEMATLTLQSSKGLHLTYSSEMPQVYIGSLNDLWQIFKYYNYL